MLTVVLLIYQLRRDLKAVSHAKWSSELHRDGLRYGLPLAFGNLAYWGLTSIDRFVLKNISGLDELGIYSMAVSFGAVALIFQSVFSTIWAPLVFKWVEEKTNLDKIGDNHAFHDRPHQRNDLPHRDFLADGDLDTAGKIHAGSIYPALVYALPPVYTLTEVSGIGLNVVRSTWLITVINIVAFIANTALLYLLVPKSVQKVRLWPAQRLFGCFLSLKPNSLHACGNLCRA